MALLPEDVAFWQQGRPAPRDYGSDISRMLEPLRELQAWRRQRAEQEMERQRPIGDLEAELVDRLLGLGPQAAQYEQVENAPPPAPESELIPPEALFPGRPGEVRPLIPVEGDVRSAIDAETEPFARVMREEGMGAPAPRQVGEVSVPPLMRAGSGREESPELGFLPAPAETREVSPAKPGLSLRGMSIEGFKRVAPLFSLFARAKEGSENRASREHIAEMHMNSRKAETDRRYQFLSARYNLDNRALQTKHLEYKQASLERDKAVEAMNKLYNSMYDIFKDESVSPAHRQMLESQYRAASIRAVEQDTIAKQALEEMNRIAQSDPKMLRTGGTELVGDTTTGEVSKPKRGLVGSMTREPGPAKPGKPSGQPKKSGLKPPDQYSQVELEKMFSSGQLKGRLEYLKRLKALRSGGK